MGHIREHIAKRRRIAGHLHPNVEALFHSQLFLDIFDRRFAYVYRLCDGAHFLGEFQPEGVDIRYHNVPGTCMLRH